MTSVYAPSAVPTLAPVPASAMNSGSAMPTQQEIELAAFEKGRLQGEMEATRRLDAERLNAPKVALLPVGHAAPLTTLQTPDIVEINRLTWTQRAAAVLGELTGLAFIGLIAAWVDRFRDGSSFGTRGTNEYWNVHYVTNMVGIFLLGNAITNYRMFPINLRPAINRVWYTLLQLGTMVCFSLSLVSLARGLTPGNRYWNVADWVFAMAYGIYMLHALWSLTRTWLAPIYYRMVRNRQNHAGAHTATHTRHHMLIETPEQRRDASAYNNGERSIYAPAPVSITRGRNVPAANQNVGAEVPNAPGNAPRWTEAPNTHAEDYWLLPRAKWATVAFWSMGAAILMDLARSAAIFATNNTPNPTNPGYYGTPIDVSGREAAVIGASGLMLLATLFFLSYVAMPPRTTLVKNGVLVDPAARRSSISHNAPTQIGGAAADPYATHHGAGYNNAAPTMV